MKKLLRQQALAYRQQLNAEEIATFELAISDSLLTLLQTFKPCTVGLFYPTRGEPNILGIVGNTALVAFEWTLPVCCESATGPALQFAAYTNTEELEVGKYNIPVPKIKRWMQPELLLVPCLAFHRNGSRLGYGAGFYDRTLAMSDVKPLTVGVAYSKTETLDQFADPHDQLLNYVVTEKSVIKCR